MVFYVDDIPKLISGQQQSSQLHVLASRSPPPWAAVPSNVYKVLFILS